MSKSGVTVFPAVGTLKPATGLPAEFGEFTPARARIERLENLSAHADSREILRWLGGFKRAPETVFLVHGEPSAQEALKAKIVETFGWRVEIPEHLQKFEL